MRTIYKTLSAKAGILLSVAALLFAAGCTDDKQASSVTATAEEIVVDNKATTVPITVRSTTEWTAYTDQDWCYVSQEHGKGTTQIFVMVGELTSDVKREANVTITSPGGQVWTIKVTQLPANNTGFSVSPKTLTVNSEASTGNSFNVKVQFAAAVVTATTTDSWITNLAPAGNSTGRKSYLFTFDTEKYTGALERQATITVTVRFGQKVYTQDVTVIQNGLGAPAISTAANIYLNHDAASHTQNIWVEGGNQENVTYQLYITASESGSDPLPEPAPIDDAPEVSNGTNPAISMSWIEGAEIVDGVLTVTTRPNSFDETREGDILIVAYRDNMTTKLNVHVSQAGHRTPGIDLKNSVITHSSEMSLGAKFILNPINNSVVTLVGTTPNWLTDLEIADDFGSFTYNLKPYDGSLGEFREASIILKADNGHTNPAYYTIKLRQYAPTAPGISNLPSYIGLTAIGTAGATITLPLNLISGTVAANLSIDASTPAWIGAAIVNGALTYNVAAYTGAAAALWREGIITLVADKGYGNKVYYYVTVRQYGDQFATLNPAKLEITGSAFVRQAFNFALNTIVSGSYISKIDVTSLTNAGWGFVGGCSNNPTIETFLQSSSFTPVSLNLEIGAVTLSDVTIGHGIQRWGFAYVTVQNGLYSQIITLPVTQTIVND